MMRKKKPMTGEVLTMNEHWRAKLFGEGVVEIENLQTGDRFRMPLAHLYSLQAIIEEVRRLYG